MLMDVTQIPRNRNLLVNYNDSKICLGLPGAASCIRL